MTRVLFYGNCQPEAIMSVLNLDNSIYYTSYISCFGTNLNENEFLKYILQSDIIITQHISDDYRNKHYLSTSFICNNAKKTTKIILFNSLHFDFYYVDLKYLKIKGDTDLFKPSGVHYHYTSIVECYNNKYSAETYINNYINNENLKTKEELDEMANKSLNELNKRYYDMKNIFNAENIYVIQINDFIDKNYKNILLFYSMNHPTKFLLQYICEIIINITKLKNSINYNIDPLDYEKGIIYKCIQKNVNFNISDCNYNVNNENNIYKIVNNYYRMYSNYNINITTNFIDC